MRYIIMIICLSLSFPAMAFDDSNTSSKTLQRKIQQDVGQKICNPEEELGMTNFN